MSGKIELLAPAGDFDAFKAAVENGADAVYLGGTLFNARQFAGNFDSENMKRAIDYAHIRDVNVYLTMNTLVTDNELQHALELAGESYLMGIDGIIIQDLGLAHAIRQFIPGLNLHASTQMTIYNTEGVRQLQKEGFKRIVLARELSFDEISKILSDTNAEIEVFIHGALCVCYSGQCLMSSIIGGRSGNRGKCAQPCRLPYQLIQETPQYESSSRGYLLSPKDLCSVDQLGRLIKLGVASLKIEGRMKSAEYVATVVRIYRKYLDQATYGYGDVPASVKRADMHDLEQIFNRGGFTEGYLKGKPGKDMMSYEKPKNQGIFLGTAVSSNVRNKTVTVRLEEDISIGDGIEIWNGEGESPGTIISSLKAGGRNAELCSRGNTVEIGNITGNIPKGSKVYKTSDKKLNDKARKSFEGRPVRIIPISGEVSLREGKPAFIRVYDDRNVVEAEGGINSEKAVSVPISEERVKEQIAKTGGTPFKFDKLSVHVEKGIVLPVSELNNVRRMALDKLEKARTLKYERNAVGLQAINKESLLHFPGNSRNAAESLKISVYVYNWCRDKDYSGINCDRIYVPLSAALDDINRGMIEQLKRNGTEVCLAIPPVTRGNYDRLINSGSDKIINCGFDSIMATNIGSIEYARKFGTHSIIADSTFNIFNSTSANALSKIGVNCITLSAEMNVAQISSLKIPSQIALEAIAYGRLVLMTSEYCAAGCIKGGCSLNNKCTGVCGRGSFSLVDRKGVKFPVLCDRIDCRSMILNSNKLFIPELLNRLKNEGVNSVRLNMTDESPEDIARLVCLYRDAGSKGEEALMQYSDVIDAVKESGFTRGHFLKGV